MRTSPFLKSILIIDDDEISNLFHKIFISKLKLNVEVDIVLNGKEGMNFLKPLSQGLSSVLLPCLLLLDIKMPEMDGWVFLDHYEAQIDKAIRDQITVVMLTTSEDEVDRIKALNNESVKEFVHKPLSEDKFKELIHKYYERTKIN